MGSMSSVAPSANDRKSYSSCRLPSLIARQEPAATGRSSRRKTQPKPLLSGLQAPEDRKAVELIVSLRETLKEAIALNINDAIVSAGWFVDRIRALPYNQRIG